MSDRLAEYGPLIDAGPTRAHIERLRSFEISVRTIHRLSGVSTKSLCSLIWGTEGRPPTRQVRQETADRLFAVKIRPELFAAGAKIGATGTARRLQALQAIGWSPSLLAMELGTAEEYIRKLSFGRYQRVLVTTALTTREVYERLWDTKPPHATPNQQGSMTRVRAKAARYGWAPPMAWDDDTIDDPNAEPEGIATVSPRGRLPHADEIAWLIDQGESHEAIAMRFKVHVKTIYSAQFRASKRKAAA